jgi:hypothetical protein
MDRMVMSYLKAFEILLKNLAGDTKEKTGSFFSRDLNPKLMITEQGCWQKSRFSV